MPPTELTGLARLPLILSYMAEEHGIDRGEYLRAAGISEDELRDPDARVPLFKIWSAWRILIDRVPDAALGIHFGEATVMRRFGLVGYAMYYSRTLLEALQRLARYSRIVSESLRYELTLEDDRGLITIQGSPRFDALRHPIDARLAGVVAGARRITRSDVSPAEVHFPYPRPEDTSEHQRFFQASLEFGRPQAMLVFRELDLKRPIHAADDTLAGYLDKFAEEIVRSLGERGTATDKVRRAIWTELSGGQPTLQHIASVLGVSDRTLQRRLQQEGTSFAAVLDSLRREMAVHLLQDHSLAVYEVAFFLGYSEPSTFYRAFRRWQGTSPQEFRRSAA
jgi:AraC-like DNA-binding protein